MKPRCEDCGKATGWGRAIRRKGRRSAAVRHLRDLVGEAMTADDFVHLYCCTEKAMCGYNGRDEPPDAERLPKCPTCLELATAPCGAPGCPEATS